jgi:hypothetical protein
MTDWDLSEADYTNARAVRETIRNFVTELSDEFSRSTIEKLVFGTVSLSDSDLELGYKSEDFTRRFLVDDLLDAVNLEYRPQPRAAGMEKDRWPDFELSNTVIPVVGEIKPLNNVSAGDDQIRTYLSLSSFDTPYGVLTDGMEWRVYGDDRSGSGYAIQNQIRLDKAFQMIANDREIISESGLSSVIRQQGVSQITDFVQTFKQEKFDDFTLISLPTPERNQYMPDDYEFQSSFEDFQ